MVENKKSKKKQSKQANQRDIVLLTWV